MEQFPLWSLIVCIILTLALNLLSLIYPQTITRLQYRLIKTIRPHYKQRTDPDKSPLRFILPFETFLIAGLVLTIALNIAVSLET